MTVLQLISQKFEVASPFSSIGQLKSILSEEKPVLLQSEDDINPVGMLTAKDATVEPQTLAIECVTEKPCISPDTSLGEAIAKLDELALDVLAVCHEEIFLGIVYRHDIEKHLSTSDGDKAPQPAQSKQDTFIHNIAHDIRGPLERIKALVELIQMSPDDPQNTANYLALIKDITSHAGCLLTDLLEAAQLSAYSHAENQMHLERESVVLLNFLKQHTALFQEDANKKNVELIVEGASEVVCAIDTVKFGRVVDNLLSNALKFTPAKGSVKVQFYQYGAGPIILSITDTGIGIPQQLQGEIFDQFTKSRRAGIRGEQATGLGLYICKCIIEMHGGNIEVYSREHQGAEFRISLPIV